MKTKDYFWCAHYHDLVTEMIRGERGRLPPPPPGVGWSFLIMKNLFVT